MTTLRVQTRRVSEGGPSLTRRVCLALTLRIAAHPTIRGVVRQAALVPVGRSQLAQAVARDGVSCRGHIHAINPGGVEAEDLRLVLPRELAVAEAFAQLVRNLEPLHQVDDPLRRAPPEAVGAPEDAIDAVMQDVLANQVH